MADEFKSIRENLFKALAGRTFGERTDDYQDAEEGGGGGPGMDAGAARALLGALFARAGKGKDEVVQVMARELGMAVAAMLKEPLAQLAKHQKLQISFEFVPKEDAAKAPEDPAPKAQAPAPPSKKVHAAKRRRKKASRAADD
jgi:hypothetical protein